MTADFLLIETRFGAFHASDRDILTLANGLPGSERCRRYVLVAAKSLDATVNLRAPIVVNPRRLIG